jgi:transposase-like protein
MGGKSLPMSTAMNAPYFHDDQKAREYLESVRWPNGPVCPHCGVMGDHPAIEGKGGKAGTKARPGLYMCSDCRQQFTVTVGTVFERSKIPLSKWLLAAYLLCSSKKGISAHQLHRTLGVTYKTAWFLAHRIRHAMSDQGGGLLGSGGGVVEADETYIGRKPGRKMAKAGAGHKNTVFALVERGGKVRSQHITGNQFNGIKKALTQNVSTEAHLMTDEARMYVNLGKAYASHQTVNHSQKEYARKGTGKAKKVSTNTIEGVFSVFKRGMIGTYQHCSPDHLHRYLAEFDWRYNHRAALEISDKNRFDHALKAIEGKRLTYRTAD